MAAVKIARFRMTSQLDEAALTNEAAVLVVCAASSIAERISGRQFGLAIEIGVPETGATVITAYNHGLAPAGTVLVGGSGLPDVDGVHEYVAIDANTIRLTTVEAMIPFETGRIAVPSVARARVYDMVANIHPGPVAKVSEVRMRAASTGGDGPFPTTAALGEDEWHCDTRTPNLSGEIEVYKNVTVQRRLRGMINPVSQKVMKEIEVSYFAGFPSSIPEDLATAISSVATTIATDPNGGFQSENFEDYSYQKVDPATLRAIPSSAISVILGYRATA